MEQTYIVKFTDDNLTQVGFERFSYKREGSVRKAIQKLWSNSLYRVCTKGATKAMIIHTPYEGCERLVDIITL